MADLSTVTDKMTLCASVLVKMGERALALVCVNAQQLGVVAFAKLLILATPKQRKIPKQDKALKALKQDKALKQGKLDKPRSVPQEICMPSLVCWPYWPSVCSKQDYVSKKQKDGPNS